MNEQNNNEINEFYLNTQKECTKWIREFVNNLPVLSSKEKADLISMTDDIHIYNIGEINEKIDNMKNISNANKHRFYAYISSLEWFDWKPDENYRFFNNCLWVRNNTKNINEWFDKEIIEDYYDNLASPEEKADYQLKNYLEKHPIIAKKLTQIERIELYEKYLKKSLSEWEKRHAEEEAVLQATLNKDNSLSYNNDDVVYMKEEDSMNNNNNNLSNINNTVDNFTITNQYINNSKISRIISTKDIAITVGDSHNDPIEIVLNDGIIHVVDLYSNEDIKLSQQITPFDMAIMDAVYTIINHGFNIFTAEAIDKVLSGNNNKKSTPKSINKIHESISKLRNINIKIDCTRELDLPKKYQSSSELVFESYLLPLNIIQAKYGANGKKIIAYNVLNKPALYTYAEQRKQIIKIPSQLLETQEQFNDTELAILIKRYVVKRVAQMKNKKNNMHSNKISYLWLDKKHGNEKRGLFAELNIEYDETNDNWRRKIKPKINNIVKETLSYLQKEKYIKGFKEYRQDGSNNPSLPIKGYEIEF